MHLNHLRDRANLQPFIRMHQLSELLLIVRCELHSINLPTMHQRVRSSAERHLHPSEHLPAWVHQIERVVHRLSFKLHELHV